MSPESMMRVCVCGMMRESETDGVVCLCESECNNLQHENCKKASEGCNYSH